MIIIGYSGHAFVVIDAALSMGLKLIGYCDSERKSDNPYKLNYLGHESNKILIDNDWIISIGDNLIREKIYNANKNFGNICTVIHCQAHISKISSIGLGSFISANANINTMSSIGKCCIVNTGSIVEHEAQIGDFAHVAPGAVLCGGVRVGNRSFVGANSVVKEGVHIGNDAIIGAGSVIIRDIPDGVTVAGNPGKIIK